MSQAALFQRCVIAQSHSHALLGFAAVHPASDTPCIAAGPVETAEISLHLFSKETLRSSCFRSQRPLWCLGLQKHINKV